MDEILKVSVFNSEFQRNFDLYVRKDRFFAFRAFLTKERPSLDSTRSSMPGLSWGGVLGFDAIFSQRPKKFPVHDILDWLRSNVLVTPAVTDSELEQALERFSALYPPDASEDA